MHYSGGLSCPVIDPVLLRLGPMVVSWYGLMYCAGAVVWYLITRHELLRRNGPVPPQALPELLFHGLVGAIIGARLGYVLLYNLPYFVESPWEIFAFWHGGMSAHGLLVGMSIGGLLFIKQHHVPLRELSDVCYLGLPMGLMFVKIGNFINCEGFGRVTTLPWGVVFPAGVGSPRHPAQLYEAVLEGLLLFAILWRIRLKPLRPGDLSCFFLVGYGIFRFAIEFFREPGDFFGFIPGSLTLGQVLSLCVIVTGVIGYALPRLHYRTATEKRC
ncbi:MAG: prolipoprotein diacylglyceryl transferase [Desulfomonilaceae bacterium]